MPAPPMPNYDVDGLVSIEMHFTYDTQLCMNKYWVQFNNTPIDDNDVHLVAQSFVGWWTDLMAPLVPETLILQEVVAKELKDGGIAVLETGDLPAPGLYAQPQLPNNVTVAVHWGTGRVGRSMHGRTYHLGLPEDAVVGNRLTPVFQGNLLGAYEALRTTLDNALLGVEYSIVSFVSQGMWRMQPLVTPITGVALDPTIDSQSRRLPVRGQ